MKPTVSPISSQKFNIDYLQSEGEGARELSNSLRNCTAIGNSSVNLIDKSGDKDRQANIIKRFLKKCIAAQSFHKMFSEGTSFQELGIGLTKPSSQKSPLTVLQHLSKISKNYLSQIKAKTPNLTLQEKILLSKVVDLKIHFRHQSNSNLNNDGTLNIISSEKLRSMNPYKHRNISDWTVNHIRNDDFVFFGVEFSGDKDKLPRHTLRFETDFGANAFIVNDQFPHGYLTLTDHCDNNVSYEENFEHEDFFERFSDVNGEVFRIVHGDKGEEDVPLFTTQDMRLGLGLHLINFLRNSRDEEFKNFVLNEDLNSDELDKILNYLFLPEFHVPRMVSTNDFREVKLREINLWDAVEASNYESISSLIKNKETAYEAMELALDQDNLEVVDFLLSNYHFSKLDRLGERCNFQYYRYNLSNGSLDVKVLKQFLNLGFVNPNITCDYGVTLLDKAVEYKNEEMIKILLDIGGKFGKEIHKYE